MFIDQFQDLSEPPQSIGVHMNVLLDNILITVILLTNRNRLAYGSGSVFLCPRLFISVHLDRQKYQHL
jgi:hypothetical protein